MLKAKIVSIIFVLILILIPILLTRNCSGFNLGNMEVSHCAFDASLLRDISNWLHGMFFLSGFMLGLPIWVYLGVTYGLGRLLYHSLLRAYSNSKK